MGPTELSQELDPFWLSVGRRCALADGSGLNCKVLFGLPDLLAEVVGRLVAEVPAGSSILSADDGVAPIAALMAQQLRRPFWMTRIRDRHDRVSLGLDPAGNRAWLSGGAMPDASTISSAVVVDDLMGSGTKTSRLQRLLAGEDREMRHVLVMFAYREEAPIAKAALGPGVDIRVMQYISSDLRELKEEAP